MWIFRNAGSSVLFPNAEGNFCPEGGFIVHISYLVNTALIRANMAETEEMLQYEEEKYTIVSPHGNLMWFYKYKESGQSLSFRTYGLFSNGKRKTDEVLVLFPISLWNINIKKAISAVHTHSL